MAHCLGASCADSTKAPCEVLPGASRGRVLRVSGVGGVMAPFRGHVGSPAAGLKSGNFRHWVVPHQWGPITR